MECAEAWQPDFFPLSRNVLFESFKVSIFHYFFLLITPPRPFLPGPIRTFRFVQIELRSGSCILMAISLFYVQSEQLPSPPGHLFLRSLALNVIRSRRIFFGWRRRPFSQFSLSKGGLPPPSPLLFEVLPPLSPSTMWYPNKVYLIPHLFSLL